MHIYIYTHKRHTKKGAAMQTVEGLRIQSSEGYHKGSKGYDNNVGSSRIWGSTGGERGV